MLIDIYTLSPMRSAVVVERFLTRFVPDRARADANYTVRIGDVEMLDKFDSPEALIAFCESEPEAEARAYWTNRTTRDPYSAHVFFLAAGGLVLGLSIAAQSELAWNRWLGELRVFAGAQYGYWICECPPEDTIANFVAVAQQHKELSRFQPQPESHGE